MPWSGGGTYTRPTTTVSPASGGTTIDAADMNALTADQTIAINACLAKNGENAATSDLPMGTNKHTGVGDATALTHYASANQVVDNTLNYCATPSAVGTDAYAVNLPISPGVYVAGNRYQFIPEVANTGACTVNFNSLGVKNIKLADGTDPHDNAIQADVPCDVQYDGASFILQNPFYEFLDATSSIQDQLDALTAIPASSITPYAGASAPSGWLLCDASAVSRTTYSALFAIISTTYGVGDGSTTFNVPDLRGRVPIGVGTGDASDATAHALADKEGTETHTLLHEESGVPAHSHNISVASSTSGGNTRIRSTDNAEDSVIATATNTAADAAQAHNNLQPSLTLNYIIKT